MESSATTITEKDAAKPLSDEVLQLIDHIAETLAEEFAAAMRPKKESGDAGSNLR